MRFRRRADLPLPRPSIMLALLTSSSELQTKEHVLTQRQVTLVTVWHLHSDHTVTLQLNTV